MFRKRHSVRLLAVVGAAALLAGCSNGGDDGQGPITLTVSDIGYFEIVPHSGLHFPGIISEITHEDGQVILNPVCSVIKSEEIMKIVQRSPVPRRRWSQLKEESTSIQTMFNDFISAGGGSSEIKKDSLEINNPEILLLTDDKLRAIKIESLKDELCNESVRELVNNNRLVCQIRSALKGDVEISTTTKEKDGMSVEAFKESNLETSAGIDSRGETIKEEHTTGEQTFFAVRLHPIGLFFHKESVDDNEYDIPKCPQL